MPVNILASVALLLIIAAMFAFGLNRYNKGAWFCCLLGSVDLFLIAHTIDVNPVVYIITGSQKFAIQPALWMAAYLIAIGIIGLGICLVCAAHFLWRRYQLTNAFSSFTRNRRTS